MAPVNGTGSRTADRSLVMSWGLWIILEVMLDFIQL
jgi:hypothetical protein